MRRLGPPLLATLCCLSCARTDPTGGACGNVLDCAAGSYCDHGSCRSDCSAEKPCAADSVCTPSGQCVSTDPLTCEEGSAPGPSAITSVLPSAQSVLFDIDTNPCNALELTTRVGELPQELETLSALGGACLEMEFVAQAHSKYLEAPGLLAQCMPALLAQDHGDWHALPNYLSYVPLDTVMEVRWGASSFELVVGDIGDSLGPPLPGSAWYSASGTLDGQFTATVDAHRIEQLLAAAYATNPQDNPGGGSPYLLQVAGKRQGDLQILDEQLFSEDEPNVESYALHVELGPAAALLQFKLTADPGDHFTLQLRKDLAGRLDGSSGGTSGSFCWKVDSGNHLIATAVQDANGTWGDPAQCAFREPP
jgi:hypothetical protein